MIHENSSGLKSRLILVASFFIFALLTACSGDSPTTPSADYRSMDGPGMSGAADEDELLRYAPGEVLVVLNDQHPTGRMVAWAADEGLLPQRIDDVPWGPLYTLKIMTDETVFDVVDRLNADERVRFAEPNYAVTFEDAPYVPNDPMWEQDDPGDDPRDSVYDQWGPAKSGAPIVWNETKGSEDIIVAVLDTGINFYHEDLYYQVWYNMDEITGNGIDDDENGYVDDWIGWNFNQNNNNPWDDGYSAYYHGSACSGIISADQDNDRGVSGIAPGVRVMAVKVNLSLWPPQAFVNSVVSGLHYAHDNDADIASMSFGTTDSSQAMQEALDAVYEDGNGMVLMASAGNNNDTQPHYPSGYDSVIAVAAVVAFSESNDRVAEQRITPSIGYHWGSSYGDKLEISGYGEKYTTTYGGHYDSYWDGYGDPDFFNGTSCACPFTAGVMALLKTYYPDENAAWLRERIQMTADDIHDVGWDNQSGYGRVNAVRAIWGSDRYSDLEDAYGFVRVILPGARYHDSLHDVPSNPYYDPSDFYTFTTGGGDLSISCYIYNWGENIDLALYSDRDMTDLVAESTINNNPYTNEESIDLPVVAGQYYLKVYSPTEGGSSLYDLTIDAPPASFEFIGYDIAPGSLPTGGDNIPFLRLEAFSDSPATIDGLNISIMGTLPLSNVTSVALWNDTNESGFFDTGDELIGQFDPELLNRITFRELGLSVTSENPLVLFATVSTTTGPGPYTLGLSLESYKDVITADGMESSYRNFPIQSSRCTVGG